MLTFEPVIETAATPTGSAEGCLTILITWAPIIIFLVVWLWYMRRMGYFTKNGGYIKRCENHMDRVEQTLDKIEEHLRKLAEQDASLGQ